MNTPDQQTRPLNVATADWKRISDELRAFSTPKVEVKEQRIRRTTVSNKWVFITRD